MQKPTTLIPLLLCVIATNAVGDHDVTSQQSVPGAGEAITFDPSELFENPPSQLGNLESIVPVNFGDWVIVEYSEPDEEGNTWALQTLNGRFEVRGTVQDNWHGIDIQSPDQLSNLVNTIPAHTLKAFDSDDVSKDILGDGFRKTWLVADPSSPATPRYVQSLLQSDRQVTVLTGRHGQSLPITARFACSDPGARAEVLVTGNVRALESSPSECNTEAQEMTEMFLSILGITVTPTLILETGRMIQGGEAIRNHLDIN